MTKPTKQELEDLDINGVNPDSIARKELYDSLRESGMSHKEAARKTIDDINSIKSDSMLPEELRAIKKALLKVPGTFF